MAAVDGKIYNNRGNTRYLATSFTLHMILFSAISFLVIEEEISTAKPLAMSVSVMLVESAEHCPFNKEQSSESIHDKAVVQKHLPTPVESKVVPIVANKPLLNHSEQAQPRVQPTTTASVATASSIPATATAQFVESHKVTAAPKVTEESVVPAIFNAAYLNNPKPNYPKISKRFGEEGVVLLKVKVLADGTAGIVTILKSSEFERLDSSALEAVKKWHFVAAKQGEKAIESWVSVPVSFKLDS